MTGSFGFTRERGRFNLSQTVAVATRGLLTRAADAPGTGVTSRGAASRRGCHDAGTGSGKGASKGAGKGKDKGGKGKNERGGWQDYRSSAWDRDRSRGDGGRWR